MRHAFHIVDSRPWPLTTALSRFLIAFGLICSLHNLGASLLFFAVLPFLLRLIFWFRDIVREGTIQGQHTTAVQKGLKIGFILFILSEVIFFFSFFWAYFHSALVPSVEIGGVWPPLGIIAPNPYHIPLLNTGVLLSSGCTLTWRHIALIKGRKKNALVGLVLTLALSVYFMALQTIEYVEMPFALSDRVYGSCFFIITGIHGFHVFVGTLLLRVSLARIWKNHFSQGVHVGYECRIWYWHFVDVVWLFVFAVIYVWPS